MDLIEFGTEAEVNYRFRREDFVSSDAKFKVGVELRLRLNFKLRLE